MKEEPIRRGRGKDGKPAQSKRPDTKHEGKTRIFDHEPE